MSKYICIHGHFYQPPRENPWTNEIDLQESAAPFKNWNERILHECYQANVSSNILGPKDEIIKIVNNFEKISFNFGPTLLSWMQEYGKETYRGILEADRTSMNHFGGHGNAIAQCYNHMIMPLANKQDQETQVIWGIKDFEYRFKRAPEGMWLPETAVNLDVLEMLAKHDIKYTILAPSQAASIKHISEPNWTETTEKSLNIQRPYLCQLPSGNNITIFFYDGVISGEIAFGKIIRSAVEITQKLMYTFYDKDEGNYLESIALDGETFGHHREFGNMALAYLTYRIEENKLVKITNYGQFLELNPPEYEVRIKENTSWSCMHGIGRWQEDCGCVIKKRKTWNQQWRKGLRDALDWLRDSVNNIYESEMNKQNRDSQTERNKYIEHILAGTNTDSLLEMQKYSMLMYTSCGWFFDDISGIETKQILQYAARAIEIAKKDYSIDLEDGFLKKLELSRSNIETEGAGRDIYLSVMKNVVKKK